MYKKILFFIVVMVFGINALGIETVFPSNLSEATHLSITLTESNEESVIQTYLAVQKVNSGRIASNKIDFLLVAPSTFQAVDDLSELGNVEISLEKIESKLKNKLSLSTLPNWKVIRSGFLQYSWLQDIGQPFWSDASGDGNLSRSFLDVNRPLESSHPTSEWPIVYDEINNQNLPLENSDFSLLALKNYFSWINYRMPNITVPYDPNFMGNQGGNIEAMPGGELYVGSTAPDQLIDYISGITGKAPLILDTSFLIVGHVDEIMTIVPANNACGFALLLADPLEGLVMSSKTSANSSGSVGDQDTLSKSLAYFQKNSGSGGLAVSNYDTSRPLRTYDTGWEDVYPFYSDWLAYKSIEAKRVIDENGTKISQSLRAQCADFTPDMVVRVPVRASYSTEVDFFQADPDPEGKAFVHFSTPTTNLVVLDNHLVMADFTNELAEVATLFKEETTERLKKIGYTDSNLHFVDASAYHIGMGSIHCGTLIFRNF